MDATCKVQDNIHVFRLVHNMCPGFWVHIRQNKLLFFSDLSTEYSFEDTIANENYDLEKIVETKMLIDRVREAIDSLNDEEREVIERLYYQDESTRIAAKALNLHKTSLIRKRDRILAKLKKMLEGNI